MQKNTTSIIIFIVGFALGFAVAWNVPRSQPADIKDVDAQDVTLQDELKDIQAESLNGSSTNGIVVKDQLPGSSVSVYFVSVDTDSWVAVHEIVGGKPGNILGAAKVFPSSKNVTVELLRPTIEGKPYVAMLHSDKGDKNFDHTVDLPLVNEEGDRIESLFLAVTPGAVTE